MNILAFFAHPDDETILVGGTLALLAQGGHRVHYLCATRGEGGERGEPPLCRQEELGEVRAAELHCAVRALGGSSLTFLDYVDPAMGTQGELYPYTEDIPSLAEQVIAHLRRLDIDMLISHGSNGEYGHPAHLVTYQAVLKTIEQLGEEAPLVYTVSATFPEHPKPHIANRDDPADVIVDIAAVFAIKVQAALCHRTQHALFVRRPSKEAGRRLSVLEVLMRLESLRRLHPRCLPQGSAPLEQALHPWLKRKGVASAAGSFRKGIRA